MLVGSFVKKFQQIDQDNFKLKLNTKQGTKDLAITPFAVFFTNYKLRASEEAGGFCTFLRKQLENKRILSAEQHGFDRILQFEFEEFFLVIELFSEGNLILTDKDYKIISCYRKQEWKDRKIMRNVQYKFPLSKGVSPTEISLTDFQRICRQSKTDIVRTLIKNLNIAPIFAEEICTRCKVEKAKEAVNLAEQQIKAVHVELQKMFGEISLANLKPIILRENSAEQILPFELLAKPATLQVSVATMNDAIDEAICKSFVTKEVAVVSEKAANAIAKLEHSLAEMEAAKARFESESQENKQKAELIYKHFDKIEQLLAAAQKETDAAKLKQKFPFVKAFDAKKKQLVVDLE